MEQLPCRAYWPTCPVFDGLQLRNYHTLAIPIYVTHTGENMYEMNTKCLTAFCGDTWKRKVIGASTDGAASMVGRLSGAVTRIIQGCMPGVYWVWCGAHQLDLAVQSGFESYVKEPFQDALHSLITYLRRRTNLVGRMKKNCLKVALTRWWSMGSVCDCFVRHMSEIKTYLEEKILFRTLNLRGGFSYIHLMTWWKISTYVLS